MFFYRFCLATNIFFTLDMDSDELYNLSTEDESFESPNILKGQKFYLYGEFVSNV